jgi:hypothetical protein
MAKKDAQSMEAAKFSDKIQETIRSRKEKMYFKLVGTATMSC